MDNNTQSPPPSLSLKYAWKVFAQYDENAKIHQKDFNWLQKWIMALGVIATVLVLSKSQFSSFFQSGTIQDGAISLIIIIVPISISILVAARNQFKFGNKWVLLRGGAEAIKREIYSYRTNSLNYSEKQIGTLTRDQVLNAKIEAITKQLLQSEVNLSAIQPYIESDKKPIPPKMYGASVHDKGYVDLTPDDYIKFRIGDQINYYDQRIAQLDLRLRIFQWLIYIMGGIGTFLAAERHELWVALTVALVGLFTTFLEYRQIQNTIMQYNQARTNLENLQNWWIALPEADRMKEKGNIDKLVDTAETILNSELTGWVQQMQGAMTKIYEQKPTSS
jgi:hypothetical protein